MPRRVRRPKEREALLDQLAPPDKEPFATRAAALVFAAALGFAHGRRSAFSKSSEEIPWEVFVNAGSEAFIEMLAAVASEDRDILAAERDDDRVLIFEEYAAGGLEIIAERVQASSRSPLDTLIDLTLEAQRRDEAAGEIDLEAIAADLAV